MEKERKGGNISNIGAILDEPTASIYKVSNYSKDFTVQRLVLSLSLSLYRSSIGNRLVESFYPR